MLVTLFATKNATCIKYSNNTLLSCALMFILAQLVFMRAWPHFNAGTEVNETPVYFFNTCPSTVIAVVAVVAVFLTCALKKIAACGPLLFKGIVLVEIATFFTKGVAGARYSVFIGLVVGLMFILGIVLVRSNVVNSSATCMQVSEVKSYIVMLWLQVWAMIAIIVTAVRVGTLHDSTEKMVETVSFDDDQAVYVLGACAGGFIASVTLFFYCGSKNYESIEASTLHSGRGASWSDDGLDEDMEAIVMT